jgi:hypothetical protein
MIGLSLIIISTIVAGALPWWPYSAAARSRRRYPWDWLFDQDRSSGPVEVSSPVEVSGPIEVSGPVEVSAATHHDLADDLADQVAQAWEKGRVTPLDEPRAAYAGRDPGAGTGQDRLVA